MPARQCTYLEPGTVGGTGDARKVVRSIPAFLGIAAFFSVSGYSVTAHGEVGLVLGVVFFTLAGATLFVLGRSLWIAYRDHESPASHEDGLGRPPRPLVATSLAFVGIVLGYSIRPSMFRSISMCLAGGVVVGEVLERRRFADIGLTARRAPAR